MAICSDSITVPIREIAVQDFLDSFGDSVDAVLEAVYYRLADAGGCGTIYSSLDTIDDSLSGASGGGSDRLVEKERFKDSQTILEVVGDDVDEVTAVHEVVDDRPTWGSLGVECSPLTP